MLYVTGDMKIGVVKDEALWGKWHNCLDELETRGYSPTEIFRSIADIQERLKLNDDIDGLIKLDPKWKKFEKVVAGIHKLKDAGAQIVFNDKIKGKRSKRNRQIDVSVRFQHSYYDYLMIVECKDYKKKVPFEKVEALRTKMDDVGAQHAVMVSSKGFQTGAVEAAKAYNIDLRTLTEVIGDWTKVAREQIIKIPYPTNIEFDHDPLTEPLDIVPMAWDDILLSQTR